MKLLYQHIIILVYKFLPEVKNISLLGQAKLIHNYRPRPHVFLGTQQNFHISL